MNGVDLMIKAVIFDLDGVIVSTDNLHYQAWKKMADKENIYFDELINNRLRGISRIESLEIILERAKRPYSKREKSELAEYKNHYYQELLSSLSPEDILPGVNDLIKKLRVKNIKIAIGSSSRNAKRIMAAIGMSETFDAVSDGTNITHSKPHPEVFLKAAEMLKIKPEFCAVVEDAESGIEAAKRAGMIAFATGDAKKSKLKNYDLIDLLKVVGI